MGHALGLLKQGLHPTLGFFLGLRTPVAHDVLPLLPVQRGMMTALCCGYRGKRSPYRTQQQKKDTMISGVAPFLYLF